MFDYLGKKALLLCVLVFSFIFCNTVQAKDGFNVFVTAGSSFGGDDINYAQNKYTGEYASAQLGDAIFIGGGITWKPIANLNDFELQFATAYHRGIEESGGVDYEMWKISFEALACFYLGDLRLGVGPVYHTGPELKITDSTSSSTDEFDPSFGYVASIDYFLKNGEGNRFSVGIKYTAIDFEIYNKTWDSNTIGINAALYF